MKKQEIIDRVKYWQKRMGLENWVITVYFKIYDSSREDGEEFTSTAKTIVDHTYLLASIYIKPFNLKRIDDAVIVHELLHCVFAEFSEYAERNNSQKESMVMYLEEKTVSVLERIFLRLCK